MSNLIEISLDGGEKIYIEAAKESIQNDSAVVLASSNNKVVKKAKEFLTDSIDQIKILADILSTSILESNSCPDEIELDFSVKFSADASIIISKVNTEANIGVKLTWKK